MCSVAREVLLNPGESPADYQFSKLSTLFFRFTTWNFQVYYVKFSINLAVQILVTNGAGDSSYRVGDASFGAW